MADADGGAVVCLAFQGGSGMVPRRIPHHRPARVHPAQLRRNVHHGDGTVRPHTPLCMRGCWREGAWLAPTVDHTRVCVCASAAGGSLRTFLELRPRDASWLPGTRRAPSSSERARRPQVNLRTTSPTRRSGTVEPGTTGLWSANGLIPASAFASSPFQGPTLYPSGTSTTTPETA